MGNAFKLQNSSTQFTKIFSFKFAFMWVMHLSYKTLLQLQEISLFWRLSTEHLSIHNHFYYKLPIYFFHNDQVNRYLLTYLEHLASY